MNASPSIAIIIPARYGSTRFPGKPLAEIGGRTMLSRVYDLAGSVAKRTANCKVFITSDDERIANHAKDIGAEFYMTDPDCPSGSDRVLAAARQLKEKPDFIVNLQGDAPFTPIVAIEAVIQTFLKNPGSNVITPVHRLSWNALDHLRENKKTTPYSGTCAILNEQGGALWFSKTIIPTIRKEDTIRAKTTLSPVHQHFGLYGYRYDALEQFCALPQGYYEQLEGLEQLRFLENSIPIQTVLINLADTEGRRPSGIDTPEDLERAEAYLQTASD